MIAFVIFLSRGSYGSWRSPRLHCHLILELLVLSLASSRARFDIKHIHRGLCSIIRSSLQSIWTLKDQIYNVTKRAHVFYREKAMLCHSSRCYSRDSGKCLALPFESGQLGKMPGLNLKFRCCYLNLWLLRQETKFPNLCHASPLTGRLSLRYALILHDSWSRLQTPD